MGDGLYVAEVLMRARIEELHAAAARERLIAGRPRRPTLAWRALTTALAVLHGRAALDGARGRRAAALSRHHR